MLGKVKTVGEDNFILHWIKLTCLFHLEEKTIQGKDLWEFIEED